MYNLHHYTDPTPMLLNRIKDILKASVNEQIERMAHAKERAEENDSDTGWRKYYEEYKKVFQEEQKAQEEYYHNTAGQGGQYQSQGSGQPHQNAANKDREYYEALEVPFGAPFADIKKSYRRLMKLYHPDLFQGDKSKLELAQKISLKINEAYTHFEKKQRN